MPSSAPPSQRVAAVDFLRGLVMVVMVLDHARDFVHRDGLTRDPTDPATTNLALFATRFVTHFCAPLFVLLAGVAARLRLQRRADRGELAGYLARRGVFLIALELLVLRPLIWFNLDYGFLAHLQVIWAIGWSMLALAGLAWLPASLLGGLGLLLVAGHNLFAHATFSLARVPSWRALEVVLHHKGGLQFGNGSVAFVQYPLIPWVGVLLLGFWLGGVYAWSAGSRRRALLAAGVGASFLFLLLRGFNTYGDPAPWSTHDTWSATLFSFLRVEKYPPSLHFLLMTLGPGLVALAVLDGNRATTGAGWFTGIGRAPLFFYVLQWPAVHLVSRLFQLVAGQPLGWDAPNPIRLGGALPRGCGFSLPIVYLAWALCLAVLVPLTMGFARFKRAHPQWRWLAYV